MSVSCSHILFAHRNLPNMVFVHLRTIIFDLQCSTISGHVQILYSSSQTYWIVCVLCGISTECTKSEEDKRRETVRWIHCIASLVPRLISSFHTWEERGNEPGDEWKSLGTRLLHCPHTQFVCMINDLGTMLLKGLYIKRVFFTWSLLCSVFFRAFKVGGGGDSSPPQTITNFVRFLDVFTISLPTKQFPP